ncbi:MAG TPA: DinB family protein [Pyrinomonadaceae bacterium]|nr:DinB family protein [Pyrinomonadaceae bacterium]
MIDRYRRWFDYERDSHAKTLASLDAVPANLRESEPFGKAVYLMGHIVAARRMWLFRLGFLKEDTDLFTRQISLAELPAQISGMETAWSQYLDQLNEDDLLRVFEYRSYEGQRFRNTIEDILTQLFGHSWYHRGQIAMLLRTLGAEPAVTDLVFWTRQPVDPS